MMLKSSNEREGERESEVQVLLLNDNASAYPWHDFILHRWHGTSLGTLVLESH